MASRTLVHSRTYPSSLPALARDLSAPSYYGASSEAFSNDSQQEIDPFLVKSPRPFKFVNRFSQSNDDSSYDIKYFKNFHDIDVGWSDDEIEEIMVISPKSTLQKEAKLANGNDVFHLLSVVGAGVAGTILLAKKPHSFKLYAIKRMRRSTLSSTKFAHDALSEQLVLKTITRLNAPFLPRLYSSFADARYLYLVMDFHARGDLLTHLLKDGKLDPEPAHFYACELVVAISFLHDAGIVHRDIKPENVLIDIAGHLVITDFGCARSISSKDSGKHRKMVGSMFCGTKEYQAPEMVLEWPHDFAVDVWGFGILIYLLNFGQHPFMEGDEASGDSMAIRQKILLDPVILSHEDAAPPLVDLIGQCLERNPVLRPKINDIKCHHYFRHVDWKVVASKEMPVPDSRILHNSNIYMPLNHSDEDFSGSSEELLLSDSLHDEKEVEHSFNGFSFEWDGDQEHNMGLELDSTTIDHEPTLLNAIKEVPESEDSRVIKAPSPIEISGGTFYGSAPQPDAVQRSNRARTFPLGLGKIWSRCRRRICVVSKRRARSCVSEQTPNNDLFATCQAADRPSRNKLRKRTRPPVAVNLPVDPASSQTSVSRSSQVSMLDVAAGTHSLCNPIGENKFGWKGLFAHVDRGRFFRTPAHRSQDLPQSKVDMIPELLGVTCQILPWSGSDLRFCRHRRVHDAMS